MPTLYGSAGKHETPVTLVNNSRFCEECQSVIGARATSAIVATSRRMRKMPFGGLLNDRVTLVKKDGTVFKRDVPASVQAKMIFIHDVSLPIETDDHILRTLPSKLDEDFVVTDATCYTGSLAHWEIKYRRTNAPLAPTQTIINNISGHNARVNIGSTDNSINQVVENSEKVFSELAEALRRNVAQDAARDRLLMLVAEMRSGTSKGTFKEGYRKFIAAAADHMTVVAPFLPALTQLL